MNITGARLIYFNQHWNLYLHADEDHEFNKEVYKKISRDGGINYFCEENGIVSFVRHVPDNETGYGGATFTLITENGSVDKIKGPWSSNATYMESIFGIYSFPTSVNLISKHITYEKLAEIADKFGFDIVTKDFKTYEVSPTKEQLKIIGEDYFEKQVAYGDVGSSKQYCEWSF